MAGLLNLAWKLLLVYLLYKLVVDFIIPVYKTTKTVKNKMNDLQQQMNEQARRQQQQQPAPQPAADKKAATPTREDYIDYEEVKS